MEKIQITDCELITLYKNGNDKAFEELLNRHKNRVFTTIVLIVKNYEVAEDLLQETFIKAVRMIKGGKYNEEGKFLPWISRIAHNLAIDYFRKHKRYPVLTVEDDSSVFQNESLSEDSFEETQIKNETYEQLAQFIEALPDSQREVLIMRHFMQMSFLEIADSTGVSINTALGRMRYALINLRKQMNQINTSYANNPNLSR